MVLSGSSFRDVYHSSDLCVSVFCSVLFFFKQKTAYEMRISDWSSDVCSSDLPNATSMPQLHTPPGRSWRKLTAPSTGLSSEIQRRAPEIGRASCRERVCQYV